MTRGATPFSAALALLLGGCSLLGAGGAGQASGGVPSRPAPAREAAEQVPLRADDKTRARTRLTLAEAYFSQGRLDIALEELAQSLRLNPDDADAYNLRGLIHLDMRQLEASEQDFQRALSISRDNSDIRHNYGYMLCQAGRYAQARQQFDAALADPAYRAREKTLLVSGICLTRAGQWLEAEAVLRRVLQFNPASTAAGQALADVLHRQRKDADARFYIRRINNSDQASAASLWLGIRVERALGHGDAVRQLAEQLRRRFPDSSELVAYDRGAFEE
ncbi:MAG: type IV pilus biogenesis/stability protein PilW [Comamonas sp.]